MIQIFESSPDLAQKIKIYQKNISNQSWELPSVNLWAQSNIANTV